MSVALSMLLQHPYFEGAKILTGMAGQDHLVSGIALLEAPDSINWINENDLIITNAYYLNSVRSRLSRVVRSLSEKKCAGIALKFDRYMSAAPDLMLETGEELAFPIVSLPYHVSPAQIINTVIYELMRNEVLGPDPGGEETFLAELLFTEIDRDSIIKKAQMVGCKRDYKPALLLIWPHEKEYLSAFYHVCRENKSPTDYFYIYKSFIICIADVTKSENRQASAMDIANRLANDIAHSTDYRDFHIGVGRCYEDSTNLAKSYYEARTAMEIAHFDGNPDIVSAFDGLGVYRILFDVKNQAGLRQFYEETVGKIVNFDKEHHTEYLNTIDVYLKNDFSVRRTAEAMYVHYNTVRYRLQKIQELVGFDLNKGDRVDIMVGVQIAKFFIYQQEMG